MISNTRCWMRISTHDAAAGEVESVESSGLDFGEAGSIVSAVSRAYFSPAKTGLTALLLGPDLVDRSPFVSNLVRAFSPKEACHGRKSHPPSRIEP
jgi:hypothetical protein